MDFLVGKEEVPHYVCRDTVSFCVDLVKCTLKGLHLPLLVEAQAGSYWKTCALPYWSLRQQLLCSAAGIVSCWMVYRLSKIKYYDIITRTDGKFIDLACRGCERIDSWKGHSLPYHGANTRTSGYSLTGLVKPFMIIDIRTEEFTINIPLRFFKLLLS